MSFPAPKPGLAIHSSFLWSHEQDAGAVEATKDRPCAIVVASRKDERGEIRTLVAPITHAPPEDPEDSLEIPAAVARTLGLDGDRHWLRLDELNRFAWPGYDLRPIPGRPGRYDYGLLPQPLFEALKQGVIERHRARRGRTQARGQAPRIAGRTERYVRRCSATRRATAAPSPVAVASEPEKPSRTAPMA